MRESKYCMSVFVFPRSRPFVWPPALALVPRAGPQFVFAGWGPKFVFTGPGPKCVFNEFPPNSCLLVLAPNLYLFALVPNLLFTIFSS